MIEIPCVLCAKNSNWNCTYATVIKIESRKCNADTKVPRYSFYVLVQSRFVSSPPTPYADQYVPMKMYFRISVRFSYRSFQFESIRSEAFIDRFNRWCVSLWCLIQFIGIMALRSYVYVFVCVYPPLVSVCT